MPTYAAKRNPDICPMHPGEMIADVLPDIGMSKTEIAKALGISRQHFYDILNGKKPVSPDVAARLGKFFGDGPGIWLRIQAAYDAWHAEREVDVSHIQTIKAA